MRTSIKKLSRNNLFVSHIVILMMLRPTQRVPVYSNFWQVSRSSLYMKFSLAGTPQPLETSEKTSSQRFTLLFSSLKQQMCT